MFAAPFATHDEQAAVGHQFGGCDELPCALEQLGVERLHQFRRLADAGAAAIQQRDEASDLLGLQAQRVQVLGLHDLHGDQVRVVRQETQQVELFEQSDNPLACDDDKAVYLVLDHQRERVEQRRIGRDGHELECGQLAHRQRIQRSTIEHRALQPGVGEDAEPIAVAHQHAAGTMRLHRRGDSDDPGCAIDNMRGAQESFVDS